MGLVLLVAVFFRFYHFPSNPPSLNWDEAAFGYNAYSILKTGKDEFGKTLPLYFRSLDDYKLPVYTYLTVLSVAVFGLTDFAVRFPSALIGVGTVGLIGMMAWFLTKNRWIAILSAFFMAILPWHIQFSRMAAEANVGLFFLVAGVTAFLYGIGKHYRFLFVSVFMFLLATYSYLSFRVLAPLIGVTLLIIYRKECFTLPKKILIGLSVGVLLVFVILLTDMRMHQGHIRFSGTSVFGTQQAIDIFQHKEREMFYDATLKINLTRRLFHDNTFFTSADILVRGYLTHFSPTFLFFDYEEKQHHTPFVGLCYLIMFPFIISGFYYVLRYQERKTSAVILSWLFLAPIPASITWDIPHAIRVYGMVIPLIILTSLGVYYSFDFIKQRKIIRIVFIIVMCVSICISSYYYFHQYMLHLPVERSKDWVYGRKEMTQYLEKNKSKYDRIVVSSRLEWPYIFMLYYSKYDPAKYLAQGGTVSGGWAEEGNTYDTYEFHKFTKKDINSSRTLFVGKPDEFNVTPLYVIYYLDGIPAIYFAEGNGKI